MTPYNLLIVLATVIISIGAFYNPSLYNKLILWPRKMETPAEYYRLLTSGFIHADWAHLFFNMLTLVFFGGSLEMILMGTGMSVLYLILYLTAIVISSLPSYIKNRNNSYYRSLGASGGVAAIIFGTVYYEPWTKMSLMFIPIGIPSIFFAAFYLIYSAYMSKRDADSINHDAHFWGAVYGFIFALGFDPTHGQSFLYQILNPQF